MARCDPVSSSTILLCVDDDVPHRTVLRLLHSHIVFHGSPSEVHVCCRRAVVHKWVESVCTNTYTSRYVHRPVAGHPGTPAFDAPPGTGFVYILSDTKPPPAWITKTLTATKQASLFRKLVIRTEIAGERYVSKDKSAGRTLLSCGVTSRKKGVGVSN